jgi:hypothetical protein
MSTIGHSQGRLQAQLLERRTREIITLNKATRPQELLYGSVKKSNQYDVRASGDMVSFLEVHFNEVEKTIKSNKDPSKPHLIHILGEKKGDVTYGDTNFYVN